MKREVCLADGVKAEIEDAYLYMAADSPADAPRWFEGCWNALETLARLSDRCPVAPESAGSGRTIRHLLYPPYRVLYEVMGKTVHVLHIRHERREKAKPEQFDEKVG